MLNQWTNNDKEIIKKLKDRYMGVLSLELNIVAFEEMAQGDNETLAQYMTRCQAQGLDAYQMMNEPRSTQLRIIWKVLSGIKDAGVRSEKKWMKSESEAKSYEEVLKIAQQSKLLNRLAAVATGTRRGYKARWPVHPS